MSAWSNGEDDDVWKTLSPKMNRTHEDLDTFVARAKAGVRKNNSFNVKNCLESFSVAHPEEDVLKLFAAQVRLFAGMCASRNRANRSKIEGKFGISPEEAATGTMDTRVSLLFSLYLWLKAHFLSLGYKLPGFVRAAYALYFDAAGIDVSPYFPIPLVHYVRRWSSDGVIENKISDGAMMDILVPEMFDPIEVVSAIAYEMSIMVNADPDLNDLCYIALAMFSKMITFGRVSKKQCKSIVQAILCILDSRSDRIMGKTSKKYSKIITFRDDDHDDIETLYKGARKLFLDVSDCFSTQTAIGQKTVSSSLADRNYDVIDDPKTARFLEYDYFDFLAFAKTSLNKSACK